MDRRALQLLEETIQDLRQRNETLATRLEQQESALRSSLTITTGDIQANAVAIGQNIEMIINQTELPPYLERQLTEVVERIYWEYFHPLRDALRRDNFLDDFPIEQFEAKFIRDFTAAPTNDREYRLRALEVCFKYEIVTEDLINQLLSDPEKSMRIRLAQLVGEYLPPLTDEQVRSLCQDHRDVAKHAVASIKKYVLAGHFTTAIFKHASPKRLQWEIRNDSSRYIVQIDDEDALPTLTNYDTTTYHLVRGRVQKYIRKLHHEDRLAGERLEQAKKLLKAYIEDGKSSRKITRQCEQALALITGQDILPDIIDDVPGLLSYTKTLEERIAYLEMKLKNQEKPTSDKTDEV